ncbi:hypothetical protein [Kitasatospora sp. NPDC005748]|uniref:hypothetical protein n=1 Tax=Kitasatospora sp. NPDC005748 TaxID=3157063 RepID=UPI00340DF14D
MTAPAATLFALAAVLAFAGLYRAVDRAARRTLRLTGALALWATCLTLIITRR